MGLEEKLPEDGKGGFLLKINSLIIVLVFVSFDVWASNNLRDIWRNNRAAKHMQQKKMLEAHEEFTQLLSEKPFHPLFQFNMGSSFIGVEEFGKAIKMYNEVLKLNPLPPEVEFSVYYNLGVLHSLEGGDIEKALKNYQNALKFQPESLEIKTNIELLISSSGGGGKGDKKDKSDQQNEDGKGEEQPKEPQEFTNKPQKQPGQFNDKEMSKGDVKKILEELKKQEQRIRAKHDRKGGREADKEKNW